MLMKSEAPTILKNHWVLVDSEGKMLINWLNNEIWYTKDKEAAEALAFQLNLREDHIKNQFSPHAVDLIKVYPAFPA